MAAPAPTDDPLPPPTPSITFTPDSGLTAGGTSVTGNLPDVTFVSAAAAPMRVFLLDSEGNAWSWGRQARAPLGRDDAYPMGTPWHLAMPEGVRFVELSSLENHSLALDTEGRVWVWGSNTNGRLGTGGPNSPDVGVPTLLTLPGNAVAAAVTAGSASSFVITTDGHVYSFGSNSFGQLGNGNRIDQRTPVRMLLPEGVQAQSVVSATEIVGVLTTCGRIFTAGGIVATDGTQRIAAETPLETTLPGGAEAVDLAAGVGVFFAIGDDGVVYSWGEGGNGRLGQDTGVGTGFGLNRANPAPVALPGTVTPYRVISSNVGGFVLDTDGHLWSWGQANNSAVLGTGDMVNQGAPVPVVLPSGVTVATLNVSNWTAVAITDDGSLLGWGGGQTLFGTATGSMQPTPTPIDFELPLPVVTEVLFGTTPGVNLVSDATGWTVDTPALSAGTVDVTITWTVGGQSRTIVIEDGFTFELPSITGGSVVIEGAAVVGGTLTAMADDFVPAAAVVTFQWLADDEPITGATGATLDLTAGMLGDVITVVATATHTGYQSKSVTSDPVTVVEGTFTGGTATITGSPVVGQTLSVSATGFVPSTDDVVFAWYVDGDPVGTGSTLALTAAMVGYEVTATATASLAGFTSRTVTSDPETVVEGTFTGGTATITGSPVVGGTLTVSASGFDPVPGDVVFQWYADGVAITGATEATLDLTYGMVGDVITVTATASLAGFTSRTVTSDPVTVVAAGFTGGTAAITGEPVVGGTLTVSATGFVPEPGDVVFQWYADGVAITGATEATLDLTAGMVGDVITVTATASLAGFTSRTVTSAPVTVVAVPQASPSPTPTETVPPTPVPTPTETPGAPTPTPTPPAHDDWECPTTAAFVDVPVGSQFHCYIEWLALTGITTGWVLETHAEFRPMLNIERQAMSAFLYRGLAEEGVFTAPGVPTFVDKNPGDTFFRHVEWMADTGITRGWEMPDGGLEYRPLAGVERQAMAAFIYRAAGSPDFTAPTTPSFRDVPASSPFFLEIEWMAQTGITVGWQYDDYRLFRPSDNVERQAMAAFLYRAFNNEGGHLDDTHLTRP